MNLFQFVSYCHSYAILILYDYPKTDTPTEYYLKFNNRNFKDIWHYTFAKPNLNQQPKSFSLEI